MTGSRASGLPGRFTITRTKAAGLTAALAVLASAPGALAEKTPAAQPSASATLRVCAAGNELPYSSRAKDGFENKIAETLAAAMGRQVEFVWSDRNAIYLIHEMLIPKQCDAVIGVDTGDERIATSKPYYRTGYVFIQKGDSPLKIQSWESPDLQNTHNVGFTPGSPAQVMMEKIGIFNANFAYMNSLTNFQDKRNRFTRVPPQRMVDEVADGTADLAVNFAPEVARYVKARSGLKMTLIPDDNVRSDGLKVPHQFDQSVGVRKDDTELLAAIDAALAKSRKQIDAILDQEGIPLVQIAEQDKRKASSKN